MKKVLYGSSALVAAGALVSPAAAEEGVKLGLGGYYNTYFWVGDNDEASGDPRDLGPTGLFADGEVHFKGSTTLDNGITFGVQIELEAFQDGDQIDENYAFIEGSFGRFVIGGEDTAAYMMQFAAPEVGALVNSGWVTSFVPPPVGVVTGSAVVPGAAASPTSASPATTATTTTTIAVTTGFRTPALGTYVDLVNDDHSIDYFSPRFSGFQLGVSYTPAATINGEGKNFPVQADQNSELHNGFSVGANFVDSFGDVDVSVAGGYRRAESPDGSGLEDPEQYSAGLNLGYAGFTIGSSFAVEDSDRATDGWGGDVGLSYSTGPWAMGVYGFHSEVEGTAGGGEDDLNVVKGAVSYAVGPGISADLTVMWAEWDGESNVESDGIGGILGMSLGF